MKRAVASLLVASVLAIPRVAQAYVEVAPVPPSLSPQQVTTRVHAALTHADFDVSTCALEHAEEAEGVATRGGASLEVRVVVLESGAWRIALGAVAPTLAGDEAATPLAACIQAALTTELGSSFSFARPPAHATEVRHRFVLSRPASPSQATRIERAIARLRPALEACVEGAESAVHVHYETMPHGFVHVVNVDGLSDARFAEQLACLQHAASEARGIPRHVVFRSTLSIMPATE